MRRHHVFTAEDLAALAPRFWPKVDKTGGPLDPILGLCWPWTGALAVNGYGQWHPHARVHVPAHRFATMLEVGRTLEFREVVMHRCRMRSCCRPEHHRIGSHHLNNAHTAAGKTGFVGEKNGQAVLTEEIVMGFRARAALGGDRAWIREEAARLGINAGHLCSCINGYAWSHLPGAVTLRKPQRNRHAEQAAMVSEFIGLPIYDSAVSP